MMERESVPPHVKRHCVLVARVATGLAHSHIARGRALDLELIERSSLLHDIAKMKSLGQQIDHGELGAQLVCEAGFSPLAAIIRDHVIVEGFRDIPILSESLLVNYSDKRVQHDHIVDLASRFEDLARRYGRNKVSRERLRCVIADYQRVEGVIFEDLDYGPENIAHHLADEFDVESICS